MCMTKTNQLRQITQGILPPLCTGDKHTGQNFLSMGPCFGTIAAEDLAIDRRRTYGLLCRPIGCFDVRLIEKSKNFIVMSGQMILEPPIAFMRQAAGQQTIQTLFQTAPSNGQSSFADSSLIAAIPQSQSVFEQLLDFSGKRFGTPRSPVHKIMSPTQEMAQTLLMLGLIKEIVWRPTIVNHGPVPIWTQNLFRDLMATAGPNNVNRGTGTHNGPKPLRVCMSKWTMQ